MFDENRYFQSGEQRLVFRLGQAILGVSICEDIWYPDGPPEAQAALGGAELLVNISSSPYHQGKGHSRELMLATRAADNPAFVAFCNLVGGQDELVFDGQSLVCGPRGEVLYRGRQFEEELGFIDLDLREVFRRRLFDTRRRKARQPRENGFECLELAAPARHERRERLAPEPAAPLDQVGEVYRALVLGAGDYVRKNGFSRVVLGLSGGVDSALTAAIAADALGAENVTCLAMPTRFSSAHSLEDARQVAENLGAHYREVSIDNTFQAFLDNLEPHFEGRGWDLTEENLQARIRGVVLMAFSNKFGWLVLTTGNKSEVGVGYSTLYGDSAGGFAAIKDVPKTLVYQLCHWRNREAGRELIPRRVLEKPPSAELRPDQKDSDSLPDYAILDPILRASVEESCSPEDIIARGYDREAVYRVIRMLDRNEYKRRQSPPGVKITPRAFGKDWRLPITNRYKV